MKTTLEKIVNAKDALTKLSQKSLPVRESYGVAKLVKAFEPELAVYNSEKLRLFRKNGELIDDGKRYRIHAEKEDEFKKEYAELLSQEVELAVKPVRLTSDLCLTAQELLALEDFIEVIADD